LDVLARQGVVGVRVDFIGLGLAPLADPGFGRLLTALADRDLVLDLQAEGEQWNEIVPAIARAPVRIAIDHMGRPRPDRGVDAPPFKAVLGLAAGGRAVVKLSGLDRFSRLDPPFVDTAPFAAAIVREFTAERLVWASDWPFLRSTRRLDYGPTLSDLEGNAADEDQRRKILDITPARWFGFPAPAQDC
jgi:predicted TIM-barrel fold metal-dependent hydrolase